MAEARVRVVQVWFVATDEEADSVVESLGLAICPDPGHAGYCEIPWAIEAVSETELPPETLRFWQQHFADERAQAGGVTDED